MSKGVIYILTNPSFPEYVKIGYTDDINQRLKQLNRSECIPFAFQLYATYDTDKVKGDEDLHKLIDLLNPGLRSIDNFNKKPRKREFYALSPEEAFLVLERISEVSGTQDRLKKVEQTKDAKDASKSSKIQKTNQKQNSDSIYKKRGPFAFSYCDIPISSEIVFIGDESKKAIVVDDKNVSYEGKIYSLSALAQKLKKTSRPLQGPHYFTYQGKRLTDLRKEKESKK